MASWVFCSRNDVKTLFPAQDSDLPDVYSEMVEGLIRQHLGAPNLGLSVSVAGEYHNGNGSNVLKVYKPPIISVSSLLINEAALSASDFVVFPNQVELVAETFPVGSLNVRVSYTSGSSTIDPVVKLTAISMIIAMVNYKRRFGADASLKWGTADTKIGEDSPSKDLGLTEHLNQIMKQTLRRQRLRVS